MLISKNFIILIVSIMIVHKNRLFAENLNIVQTEEKQISNIKSDDNISNKESEGTSIKSSSKYNLSDWKDSVFFNDVEIKSVKDELFKLKNSVKEQDSKKTENISPIINSIVDKIVAKKEEVPKQSPNFYLNSILYKSKDKWTIWLNKKEIRSENDKSIDIDEFNEIKIVKVDSKQVDIEWKTNFLDKFCPNIKDIIKNKDDPIYKDINIDYKNNKILIKLRINQTFISKDMLIKEGYIESSLIENNQENNVSNMQNRK